MVIALNVYYWYYYKGQARQKWRRDSVLLLVCFLTGSKRLFTTIVNRRALTHQVHPAQLRCVITAIWAFYVLASSNRQTGLGGGGGRWYVRIVFSADWTFEIGMWIHVWNGVVECPNQNWIPIRYGNSTLWLIGIHWSTKIGIVPANQNGMSPIQFDTEITHMFNDNSLSVREQEVG